jgi:hypothetical protein
VGIAWDEATVEEAERQRLVELIVEVGGISPEQVVRDAVPSSRDAVAYQVERDALDRLVELRERLEEAARAYRGGDLERAELEATRVARALEVDPLAPGSTRLAWSAHLLRAQVAWTQADDAATDEMLRAAVALDPRAQPSTRHVPPSFAAEHRRIQAEVLAERASWPSLVLETSETTFFVEVDGRPGLRPVPSGTHFVVVRRPGRAPVAAAVSTDTPWEVPASLELIPDAVPVDRTLAEAVCERLDLGHLVLARVRDGRWGLQGYACGEGFGPAWYEEPQSGLPEGVSVALALAGGAFDRVEAAIIGDEPWPAPRILAPPPPPRVDVLAEPKPWHKRVWVWTLVGGTVAAAVITGIVLGTRSDRRTIAVDWGTFTNPNGR